MEKRKNLAVVCLTAAFLLGFLIWGLCKPDDAVSVSERRKLAQKPELTLSSVLRGEFMTKFETYTLDQFPLRDGFRRLKAVTLLDVLQEKDNNGIYVADGYAAKLDPSSTKPPCSTRRTGSSSSMTAIWPGPMRRSTRPSSRIKTPSWPGRTATRPMIRQTYPRCWHRACRMRP